MRTPALFLVAVLCLLAAPARAQNNCTLPSGQCQAYTFRAGGPSVLPSLQVRSLVNLPDAGDLCYGLQDGGSRVCLIPDGTVDSESFSACDALDPRACAADVSLDNLQVGPNGIVKTNAGNNGFPNPFGLYSAQYPDAGVVPFVATALSVFAPTQCVWEWDNGYNTFSACVTGGGGFKFGDGTIQTTAATGGGGTVTGTGASTRVAYWSGTSSLTSSADMTYSSGSKALLLTGAGEVEAGFFLNDTTDANAVAMRALPASGSGLNRGIDLYEGSTNSPALKIGAIGATGWISDFTGALIASTFNPSGTAGAQNLYLSAANGNLANGIRSTDIGLTVEANSNRVGINTGTGALTSTLQVTGTAAVSSTLTAARANVATLGVKQAAGTGCAGFANLSSGAVTVTTTCVQSDSVILLTHGGGGVLVNYGTLYSDTVSAGVSFAIKSTNVADSDGVHYLIVNNY